MSRPRRPRPQAATNDNNNRLCLEADQVDVEVTPPGESVEVLAGLALDPERAAVVADRLAVLEAKVAAAVGRSQAPGRSRPLTVVELDLGPGQPFKVLLRTSVSRDSSQKRPL